MKTLTILLASTLLIGNASIKADTVAANKPFDIVVYRSPSCGCCGKWLAHLQDNNFNVQDILTPDVQTIKQKYGVSAKMASCHTALVGGYVVEGHVPATDIQKMLKIKPKIAGIAVPGMPNGTPGMEMGEGQDAYNVISFSKDNTYDIFNSYPAKP
ncbi:MAG: DUF411 domain-containing protein [Methylococcales bacterium]|nr:DUF411 domain-containing protein [Methylococcales bacterium]